MIFRPAPAVIEKALQACRGLMTTQLPSEPLKL